MIKGFWEEGEYVKKEEVYMCKVRISSGLSGYLFIRTTVLDNRLSVLYTALPHASTQEAVRRRCQTARVEGFGTETRIICVQPFG